MSIKQLFQSLTERAEKTQDNLTETVENVSAALREPAALKDSSSALEGTKATLGGAVTAAGVMALDFLVTAGGAVLAWEAIAKLSQAGQKWRASHSKKSQPELRP